jgi:hypothetical protein
MSALFEDTFVLSRKGMWQKNSVIVAWVLEFIREVIILFRCTRNVQGQFVGDPLVDKMENAVCNAKRNRRVHRKLVLWYVCGLLRQTYYGSFEKGYTFK